jgi:hypothetical protein
MLKPYHQLTIIRNRSRLHELWQFRDIVEAYFARSERDESGVPIDWEGAQAARSRINQMLPRIMQIVHAAGLGATARHPATTNPSPALGRVDVLERIFSASYANGLDQEILDVIDMAIGAYDADRFAAMVRTVNPLHYAGAVLRFVARIPRRLLSAIGLGGGRRAAALGPADVARIEVVAARLAEVEDVIDARIATALDRVAQRRADDARQLAELTERLDFAERLLAGQPTSPRFPAPKSPGMTTPV